MDALKKILQEITNITTKLETNYPELYRTLNENPLTIPSEGDPRIDIESMKSYLESLKELLRHYLNTHQAT